MLLLGPLLVTVPAPVSIDQPGEPGAAWYGPEAVPTSLQVGDVSLQSSHAEAAALLDNSLSTVDQLVSFMSPCTFV